MDGALFIHILHQGPVYVTYVLNWTPGIQYGSNHVPLRPATPDADPDETHTVRRHEAAQLIARQCPQAVVTATQGLILPTPNTIEFNTGLIERFLLHWEGEDNARTDG